MAALGLQERGVEQAFLLSDGTWADRKLALEMLGDYRPRGEKPDEDERKREEEWLKELREAA